MAAGTGASGPRARRILCRNGCSPDRQSLSGRLQDEPLLKPWTYPGYSRWRSKSKSLAMMPPALRSLHHATVTSLKRFAFV